MSDCSTCMFTVICEQEEENCRHYEPLRKLTDNEFKVILAVMGGRKEKNSD